MILPFPVCVAKCSLGLFGTSGVTESLFLGTKGGGPDLNRGWGWGVQEDDIAMKGAQSKVKWGGMGPQPLPPPPVVTPFWDGFGFEPLALTLRHLSLLIAVLLSYTAKPMHGLQAPVFSIVHVL